jgi:hypothetical protein
VNGGWPDRFIAFFGIQPLISPRILMQRGEPT